MKVSYLSVFIALIMLMSVANVSMGATCNPLQLISCYNSITSGTPPSSTCCSQLRSQAPCFCQYLKDPSFSQYVNSPNAKKTASACGIASPRC
ncbi:Non-specific lipid-transfer protein [Thalictrum thalictroides]|uniref:Non-specific lipid-transfer protein n=1 Tax=Thalictrum thalictroides TaxID=46969 RepID=A0A7J6VB79_THATH|nr:Non-specific lipid-transfer protein [Thalictrum thalictroides]